MSHVIYLLRHAIAAPAKGGMRDRDRALTSAGRRKMQRAAAGLKRLGVRPDVILSSPLRRTMETAELVADALKPRSSVRAYAPLAPGHEQAGVLAGLRYYRDVGDLLLVGHQPDMGLLASWLITGAAGLAELPFRKGAVAAIRVAALPPRDPGQLLWFMTPRQLRALAGRRR